MKTLLCRLGLVIALVVAVVAPASAAVTISFYSHKFHYALSGVTQYPHAFVVLNGTTDDGQAVNTNLGFSAVTPSYTLAVLGPLPGALDDVPLRSGYVAEATFHFSFPLTDGQARAVLAAADKWRNAPQPSYDLWSRNCVTFIRDIAIAAGLSVGGEKDNRFDPRAFLDDVAARNTAFLTQHDDHLKSIPAENNN
ncbi:MAG TPA: hypothetical protein VFW28_11550 [Micropepsaceae bacterium]|nr:hypothetical protein [Micropepsaceae bacterium]